MATTYVLKKIPLWPVIRISFVLFLILGIIVGIIYALIISVSGLFAEAFSGAFGGDLGFLKGLGFVLIPVIAILYGIFGTIVVAIWTIVYNLIASVVGGVELTLEPAERAYAAPVPPSAAGGAPGQPPGGKTIDGF